MQDFPVSPGKIITIRKNGQKIPMNYRYDLTLSTELTLTFRSDFDYLLSQDNPAFIAMQLMTQAYQHTTQRSESFTGRFKEMGYQIWKGTDPVTFTFETMLNMHTSGEKDVLMPAKELINICLPSDSKKEGQIGLTAPGPSIFTAAEGALGESPSDVWYSITVGSFYLPNVIIKAVEPTFSSEVDDRGFPIWCSLKIDAVSVSTATTQIVDSFGSAYLQRR